MSLGVNSKVVAMEVTGLDLETVSQPMRVRLYTSIIPKPRMAGSSCTGLPLLFSCHTKHENGVKMPQIPRQSVKPMDQQHI